ncbi:UNVERIFIED_CONTAM: hypothetical protein GTU68_034241 [Idotea baltica]|nr:hypothetical protein [Idotea baltica]
MPSRNSAKYHEPQLFLTEKPVDQRASALLKCLTMVTLRTPSAP